MPEKSPEHSHMADVSSAPAPDSDAVSLTIPQDATPYARALYPKVQAHMQRSEYPEAFKLTFQIHQDAPKAVFPLQLMRQIGVHIYKTEAAALSDVLARGDLQAICSLVHRLRLMADETQLRTLPGYRTAAEKVAEVQRKRAYSHLAAAINALRNEPDISKCEVLAKQIENQVQVARLQLKDEDKVLIATVHQKWAAYCRHQELLKKYHEHVAVYTEIKQLIAAKEEMPQCRDRLIQLLESLDELNELQEAQDLRVDIQKNLAGVRKSIFDQCRRKVIMSSVTGILILLVVFVVSTLIYSLVTAVSREQALRDARVAKNVTLVREELDAIEPLRGLRTMLNSSYEKELSMAAAWLEEHQAICKKATDMEQELQKAVDAVNSDQVTPDQLTSGLLLVQEATQLCQELDARFNCRAGANLQKLIHKYNENMASIRPTVLARFTAPSTNLDLAGLQSLYNEYLGCRELLAVSYDEHDVVSRAFSGAVSAELSRLSAAASTPEEAANLVHVFDRYNSTMKLDASLRQALEDYARRFDLFNKLPQKLMTVKNITEYVQAVQACGDCYARVPNATPLAALEAIVGNETAAMRTFKLREFFKNLPAGMSEEAVLQQLQTLRAVYVDGASLFKAFPPDEEVTKVIADVTTDSKSLWHKRFMGAVGNGNYVYIGVKMTDRTLREYNSAGKQSRKITTKNKNTPLHEVRLHDVRQTTGFLPSKLKAGEYLPAQLLMNVARFSDEKCPVYARAYLFQSMCSIIAQMDELASGVAFSPSLRQDLAAFKKLPNVKNKKYGCWMEAHKLESEKPYINFFTQAAEHDYISEIKSAMLPITDSVALYAGFIDAAGKAIRTVAGDDTLFVMVNGKLEVYSDTASYAPYTPIFRMEITSPQPVAP